jgi:hypothetical protein
VPLSECEPTHDNWVQAAILLGLATPFALAGTPLARSRRAVAWWLIGGALTIPVWLVVEVAFLLSSYSNS